MEFKFCPHSQLNSQELEKIVDLKKRHWNYSSEEHVNWIQNNINDEDIHVLMFEKEELVAYLNLINTEVIINDTIQFFIGIGNVCSKEKGKGYGGLLINEVNQYLIVQKKLGILLCKVDLIDFYKKYNWKLVNEVLTGNSIGGNVKIMLFNYENEIITFQYLGRNF